MAIIYNGVRVLEPVSSAIWGADETQAQEVILDTASRPYLEVYVSASAGTNIHLDVSPDGVNWVEDYELWGGYSSVKEGYTNAFRYVRVRTDAAGSAGDKITIVLTAK